MEQNCVNRFITKIDDVIPSMLETVVTSLVRPFTVIVKMQRNLKIFMPSVRSVNAISIFAISDLLKCTHSGPVWSTFKA